MKSSVQRTADLLTCSEVTDTGTLHWYDENGKHHRENGPAGIYPNGSQYWARHGELHREDGPAYIRYDGYVEYWIDARRLSEEQFNARKLTINR